MQVTKSTLAQSMLKASVLIVILFFAFGAFATDFMPDTLLKPTVTFGGAPATASITDSFTVTATDESESGKTATITATGSCTVPTGSTGGTVTVTMTKSTGSCTVKASWAADTKYAAATATQKTVAYLGYNESVIYPFFSQSPDGAQPGCNGMIMDTAGNIYGTTQAALPTGGGAVFELSPAEGGGWAEKVLFLFNSESTGFNGYSPCGTLARDSKGNLYGTTLFGGDPSACVNRAGGGLGCGTVYELSPTETGYWTPTLIYSFKGGNTDGFGPVAGVTLGNTSGTILYGTTTCGGTGVLVDLGGTCETNLVPTGAGTVYELAYTKKTATNPGGWKETILYNFPGNPNSGVYQLYPSTGLLLKNGSLYSSVSSYVYELQPGASGWTFNVLYEGANAGPQYGTLATDTAGNLYGTPSSEFGSNGAAVWELKYNSTAKTYTMQTLYTLNGIHGDTISWGPIVYKNNLYATTGGQNSNACGTAFELTYSAKTGWQKTALWQFTGSQPNSTDLCMVGYNQLIVDTKGNFYGMGMIGPGPTDSNGGVFEISPK